MIHLQQQQKQQQQQPCMSATIYFRSMIVHVSHEILSQYDCACQPQYTLEYDHACEP